MASWHGQRAKAHIVGELLHLGDDGFPCEAREGDRAAWIIIRYNTRVLHCGRRAGPGSHAPTTLLPHVALLSDCGRPESHLLSRV